jgi:hypothetical protein
MMLGPAGIKAIWRLDRRIFGRASTGSLVDKVLEKYPSSGHMFVFRGKRTNMIRFCSGTGAGSACRRSG